MNIVDSVLLSNKNFVSERRKKTGLTMNEAVNVGIRIATCVKKITKASEK